MCVRAWIDGRPPFWCWIIRYRDRFMPILSGNASLQNILYNIADKWKCRHMSSDRFSVSAYFYCVLLLYQKQLILSRKPQRESTGVTLLAKKVLRHNAFFAHFLRGKVNIPGRPKRVSKALHSRILAPIFVQPEVVIPEIQNGEKYVLRCNGFMAPKCVTRIAVAVFLVCDKIFSKNNAIFNAEWRDDKWRAFQKR